MSRKNNKNNKKSDKKGNKKGAFISFLAVGAFAVVCLFVCQFLLGNSITSGTTLLENTTINGVDVSNMTLTEAENVVLTNMLVGLSDVEINLSYGDKTWTISHSDFEVINNLEPRIKEVAESQKSGNFFENMKKAKKTKEEGADFSISYLSIISNLDNRIDDIIEEIEQPLVDASIIFSPDDENVFSVDGGQKEIKVDRDALYEKIEDELDSGVVANVEIPTIEVYPEYDEEELLSQVVKRGEFSTSYAKSSKERKQNIQLALSKFNGLVVESGETVSFNEITGSRTAENGYKDAHVIFEGVYIDGIGGGVCQASTTLYNALLLADIQIDEVYHHTIPSSYVDLSFDAMVTESYADLVFTNNLEHDIYIKTSATDTDITVTIYGEDMDGTTIKTRSQLVKVLPHNGDKIVPDTEGKYEDEVLYKGEYYRLKWPRQGYESKGYVEYYKDGEKVDEKEVRHDFYPPADGVVIEGAEELGEGMSLPEENFTIISPSK